LAAELLPFDNVFINCPLDDDYAPTFRGLIFSIYACGFRPRSAREVEDASQTRIAKLTKIIEQCRFGIHDLSRTQLDPINHLPRFNMPLELGLFLGAKFYGGDVQQNKRALIMDVDRYRFQKFISDLAGMDINEHNGDVLIAVRVTRNWLANVSRRKIQSADRIVQLYQNFTAELPLDAAALGFDPNNIPYVDFERMVVAWLTPDA
jgi:hypothetical protein